MPHTSPDALPTASAQRADAPPEEDRMPSDPNNRHFDVIIVGARVAGSATALLLARAGARVLVVDRQAHGSDTMSTLALMRGGVHLLSRWGLLEPLLAAGSPLVTSTTFHYGDEELAIQLRTDETVPGLIAPRRTLLDALLVDAARAAGAVVRHHTSVRNLLTDARGRVCGVTIEGPGGATESHRASLVVGADGIGSTVARLVRARLIGRGAHAAANLYGYFPGMGNNGYHWYYQRGAAAGVIPTNDGLSCVFGSAPTADFDDHLRHDVAAAFRQLLATANPELGDRIARLPGAALSVFRGRPGYLREAHGPGWALVGDAGFFRDPLTAHGMTDALRDAEALSEAIIRGTEYDMRRYQAERNALALPLLATTDSIVAFDWDLETLQGLHKELNQAMKSELAVIAARSTPSAAAIGK
jgi:2-polyprenyl-6-methoxyphenol hydroxylase-like FAD-dependent oxidoreductase